MQNAEKQRRGSTLGFLPILFYNVHAAYWVFRGGWENSLWICHVASLLIGFGLILELPALNLAGVLWLLVGNFFWFLYLAFGGEFLPTSFLTHIGSLIIGMVGINRMGAPASTWWRAGLGMIPLHLAAKLTPPAENVNLAHRIEHGWEQIFPTHLVYVLSVFVVCLAAFYAAERLLSRLRRG